MHILAVERTPPELWLNILAIATRSPQLPYPDDTFLQATSLFLADCNQDRISRDWTRLVTSCRLVCRSWQAAIERLDMPLIVQCNVEKLPGLPCPNHILPYPLESKITRAHRLETWHPHGCDCSSTRPCLSSQSESRLMDIRRLRREQMRHRGDWEDKYPDPRSHSSRVISGGPTSNFSRLSIFIARHYIPPDNPVALLDQMPALRALVWGDEWSAFCFDSVLRHKVNQQLTHLQLCFAWEDLYTLKQPAHFPQLHHLFLKVYRGHRNPLTKKASDLNLSTWATFPVLRSLYLEADVPSGQNDIVLAFLAQCGATLSSLKANLSTQYTDIVLPIKWELFPHLVEFGPGINTLVTKPPPPPARIRPLTLIFSFFERYGYPPNTDAMVPWTNILASFMDGCRQWQTKVVRMVETWEEIDAFLRGRPDWYDGKYALPRHAEFYRVLLNNGIEVHDRNGVSAESSVAVSVLARLHSWSVLPIDEENDEEQVEEVEEQGEEDEEGQGEEEEEQEDEEQEEEEQEDEEQDEDAV